MFHLRHLIRPLAVVALLASTLALAVAAPAGAQGSPKVITFTNGESGAGADDWEVQISAQALGGCNPPNARAGHVTSWLGHDGTNGEEDGAVLDPSVCNYRITAVARKTADPGKLCEATVQWGTGGTASATIETRGRPSDEATVLAAHTGGDTPKCAARPTLAITIDPEKVVEALPSSAADSNLKARAERAVVITDFRVKVTPDSTTVGRTGCNQTLDFEVTGDGEEEEKALDSIGSGVTCKFKIAVSSAPHPFVVLKTGGTSFSSDDADSDGKIDLDLSTHVQLPFNRIVIIQDVTNNPVNAGNASYKVTSVCAGVAALPPIARPGGSGIFTLPGGQTVATLNNGRFTVHSPDFANFGVGASYPAVATGTTSNEMGGCSVTVSIDLKAPGCRLSGADTRTLTWTSANPIRNFDFEFDIDCGTQPPESEVPPPTPPPSTGDSSGTSTDTSTTATAPEAATDTVRLVARLLENGKIEFGLQQRQHDGDWSDRIFPRARLFPAETAVGRWLVSSAITLSVAESANDFADDTHVRIIARKQADGRVEFGLQQSDDGGATWGERMLPTRRYFPPSAAALRWLGSSNITVDG